MPDLIRVRAKDTGHEFTIPKGQWDSKVYEKSDDDALGRDGLPAPVKYHQTSATKTATKKTGQKAAPDKEK